MLLCLLLPSSGSWMALPRRGRIFSILHCMCTGTYVPRWTFRGLFLFFSFSFLFVFFFFLFRNSTDRRGNGTEREGFPVGEGIGLARHAWPADMERLGYLWSLCVLICRRFGVLSCTCTVVISLQKWPGAKYLCCWGGMIFGRYSNLGVSIVHSKSTKTWYKPLLTTPNLPDSNHPLHMHILL